MSYQVFLFSIKVQCSIRLKVDVLLSKSLAENLYLFQYPVRPGFMPYDEVRHLSARIKPKQQKVEMELSVNTRSPNYAISKGEQVALNVDGPQGVGNYYQSGMMDKQVLASEPSVISTSRYAVGVLKDGELHLTPLHGCVQLHPSFNYLDKADNREKDTADAGESSQDEGEEEAKPVMVRFGRPESDEAKARRLASYEYLNKKQEEENWVTCRYNQIQDEKAEQERLLLYANSGNEMTEFCTPPQEYLKQLMPEMKNVEEEKPALPNNVLAMNQLKTMPLSDQVKALLINAKVIKFSQLMTFLPRGTDEDAAIRSLQQVAMMVQGCWVVKSEVLYPKDSFSAHSGVSAEVLSRVRDYVMWKFTQNRYVTRKEISSVVRMQSEDLKDILEQMSKMKVHHGWEFVCGFDEDFVDRNPEVVNRQNKLWELKIQQITKSFKAAKETPVSPEKSKRRRTISRSRTKSGSGMSDLSDTDIADGKVKTERQRRQSGAGDRQRRKSGHAMEVDPPAAENHVSNGPTDNTTNGAAVLSPSTQTDNTNNTTSVELRTELTNFIQEKLYSRYVLTLSDLKKLYQMKLAQCAPGHVLASGVTDHLLQKTVIEVGGSQLQVQWPPSSQEEPIFALLKTGDKLDQARAMLSELLKKSHKIKSSALRKRYEDETGEVLNESDCKRILKDYCVTKGSVWHLKGIPET
ncbi:DNA-directed RNA polymerase III subunit RPC5 isoform X1 [Lingula anatina]|uniref:DNA-directed RNA polymerase III subunit RPC5 isoform X1 n=1 Tax=Lingula anatina TaxID=7574 RepID=A0A1S3H7P9_LINAN|nr:DNA-directed RNA polymerase III subunit RPC5 isoform X1 [Lingula anatina]|eukprot:XP_013381144.1 DNA-directed RNA polymerase III subunit RPC5 isoform X1 [Lingula anatina]